VRQCKPCPAPRTPGDNRNLQAHVQTANPWALGARGRRPFPSTAPGS
jgi:hypothetical protein